MKKNFLLLFVASGIFLSSCNKQPVAGFTTDKDTYTAGETIHCQNSSVDAESFLWTFSGGTSKAENLDLEIPVDYGAGEITIKLDVESKNGKKSDSESKTVKVNPATGNAVFWQSVNSGFGITYVYIGNVAATITLEYNNSVSCGTNGCANFMNLEVGVHSYYATDGIYEWEGVIIVQKDNCTSFHLQ